MRVPREIIYAFFFLTTFDKSCSKVGNYDVFLRLEEKIPTYSGSKFFNDSCIPDVAAFAVINDLQMSPVSKETFLHENTCRIDANLVCDEKSKMCKCLDFGGSTSVWSEDELHCVAMTGTRCRPIVKFHAGFQRRTVHQPQCVEGASCANFVYDTEELCKCDGDGPLDHKKPGFCPLLSGYDPLFKPLNHWLPLLLSIDVIALV